MAYYQVIQLAVILMAFTQLAATQNSTEFKFPNATTTSPNSTHAEGPPIIDPLCMMPAILCFLSPYTVHLIVAVILVGLAYWQREVLTSRAAPVIHARVLTPLRRRQAIRRRPAGDAEQGVNLPQYQPYQGRQERDDRVGLGALPFLQTIAVAGLDAGLGQ